MLVKLPFSTAEEILEGQVLVFDKPLTWTSFDVVNKVRGTLKGVFGFRKVKVGHAGTLDPLATGVLVICTGRITKTIDLLQAEEKTYTGTIRLGATTPSFDAETEVDSWGDAEKVAALKAEEIDRATNQKPGFSDNQDDWQLVRNGLDFFRQHFAREYMVLLD